MNERAFAYLTRHGKWIDINGQEELMLPLDRIQGFLDLLTPADVPPEKLQTLYKYQAEAVNAIRAHFEGRMPEDTDSARSG